jgi:serine/threonine protein kinase
LDEGLFEVGARVGDYTVEYAIAREESGVVYFATHLLLPRKVALKVGSHARPMAVQLLREACLLEALSHGGIPRVFECGVLPDRRPWVAFERIDGPTLSTTLGSGPMPIVDLVVLIRDISEILHHAHARGVVHRRISADTIVRTTDRPTPLVLGGWADARTVDSVNHLDAREDVYALGVIAFRALTGCLHTPSVSSTDWAPWAPSELTALIDVMLDANPRVRPTAEEVRERARWLATTIEPLEISRPRWTPPNGLDPETHEPRPLGASASFSIRIGGSRTAQ